MEQRLFVRLYAAVLMLDGALMAQHFGRDLMALALCCISVAIAGWALKAR